VATTTIRRKKIRVLPGFKLTLGFTVFYLGLIVLIPLAAVFWKTSSLTWAEFWQTVTMPTAMASYRLTFGASFLAALVNAVFGLIVAWVLVRYEFFGKKIVDALVDLPFALPTAVAGITLAAMYSQNGWIGYFLESWIPRQSLIFHSHQIIDRLSKIESLHSIVEWIATIFHPVWHWFVTHTPNSPLGIHVAQTPIGVFIALTFIGLPFIVRTVQPIIEDLDPELEEAASSLGANRWQVFWRVIFPTLTPALLTGFALAFARALGEYGSVIFIAGNIPMKTQITAVVIMGELDMFDYAKATAIAVVMLVFSFVLLLTINVLQWWTNRYNTNNLA
jgi:sulfate transport system permease protein